MDIIISLSNSKVKLVRSLQERRRVRQQEQHFVLEGVRLIEESVRAGARINFVFYTEIGGIGERQGQLLATLRAVGTACYPVSEEVMAACSDTQTPQGVLAVVANVDLPCPAPLTFTLVVDNIRDPGNLGTILRTAWATGVERVLLSPGTVDATNPKVVRSAMGAHFHLPIATRPWQTIAELISGTHVWLAAADGETIYTDVDWKQPCTLIMGSEAAGVGQSARLLSHGQVHIPMIAEVESLNAAVATAVILFEVVRQRGLSGRINA